MYFNEEANRDKKALSVMGSHLALSYNTDSALPVPLLLHRV